VRIYWHLRIVIRLVENGTSIAIAASTLRSGGKTAGSELHERTL